MRTKELVLMSLLVGMGAVLHTVIPGLFFGMKPDMLLTMMFLGIVLFPNVKNVTLLGILTGIISGMTTNFPGGQIPNMIDKPITAFLFFGLFVLVKKINKEYIKILFLTAVGTLISGLIFLGSATFIVGLPGGASFIALYLSVVLPTAGINIVIMSVIYPTVQKLAKRLQFV